jgi:cytochrome c1
MHRLPIVIAAVAVGLAACGDAHQLTTSSSVYGPPNVVAGNQLMRSHGCLGCHTVDGEKSSGPTLKGVAGSQVQLSDGTTVTADDAYLREAIEEPSAQTVKGFPEGFMANSIDHRQKLTPKEVNDVVAYIDSLK